MAFTTKIEVKIKNDTQTGEEIWEVIRDAKKSKYIENKELVLLKLYEYGLFISPVNSLPDDFLEQETEEVLVGISGRDTIFYLKNVEFTDRGIAADCFCEAPTQAASPSQVIQELLIPLGLYQPVLGNPTGSVDPVEGKYGDWTFKTKDEMVTLTLKDVRMS